MNRSLWRRNRQLSALAIPLDDPSVCPLRLHRSLRYLGPAAVRSVRHIPTDPHLGGRREVSLRRNTLFVRSLGCCPDGPGRQPPTSAHLSSYPRCTAGNSQHRRSGRTPLRRPRTRWGWPTAIGRYPRRLRPLFWRPASRVPDAPCRRGRSSPRRRRGASARRRRGSSCWPLPRTRARSPRRRSARRCPGSIRGSRRGP